jgi:hypothetical protein
MSGRDRSCVPSHDASTLLSNKCVPRGCGAVEQSAPAHRWNCICPRLGFGTHSESPNARRAFKASRSLEKASSRSTIKAHRLCQHYRAQRRWVPGLEQGKRTKSDRQGRDGPALIRDRRCALDDKPSPGGTIEPLAGPPDRPEKQCIARNLSIVIGHGPISRGVK